ncbi:hypothetical protein AMATHDRAFT_76969 [Amanita thiersii Skay4041]|uniref:Glycosyl transferase family 25 domain-containing protein n=1 Tax=Amanita thiersii Skay4041 TaxID=703135 RepID=A0A2A9NBD5_9AGAR|nr:hypothetical protein AMATHDRAFT_76969 [Amanita thiersii Skay4041]
MATLRIRIAVLIIAGFLALLFLLCYYPVTNSPLSVHYTSEQNYSAAPLEWRRGSPTLGIASEIYVVSLPRREERWREMERLRSALGLRWTYHPATEANDTIVGAIMQREHHNIPLSSYCSFSWPADISTLAESTEILDLWTPDFLKPESISKLSEDWQIHPFPPLLCTTRNYTVGNYPAKPPKHLYLTPARVACWHSHLSLIHRIANKENLEMRDSVLILEDDVDMERDIRGQLAGMWPLLPDDWDIVYLGFCWSSEGVAAPLKNPNDDLTQEKPPKFRLFPSRSPKCTHAYALSKIGARRLLLHLRYAPFAYSRSIDQALAWLIESGRLKSYTVVPSLVAQRKIVDSDIMPGTGSKWRYHLLDGVLGL